MYDVITFGSATVDVFAMTEAEKISIKHGEFIEEFVAYTSGSKILIEDLHFDIGGGGTNTAVAFSRLGLKTAYCGKLGKDANADRIVSLLSEENIDFIGKRAKGQTGYSVILDSHDEDRTILTYKGLNNKLHISDIDKSKLKAKWFYFSSLVGDSYKTFESLTAYAKKNGIKVGFNPSSYLAKMGAKFLKKALKNTDYLVLNLEEAELVTGKKERMEWQLKKLASYGPELVIITDGGDGAFLFDKNSEHIYHKPSNDVKVLETTGAGDSFASSFLAGLIMKNNLKFALDVAAANASSVITHVGAKNRLLTLKEATVAMKKNKRVVIVK